METPPKGPLDYPAKQEGESVRQIPWPFLRPGLKIALVKRNLSQGAESKIEVGSMIRGTIKEAVELGKPIYFTEGGNTSNIKAFKEKDGKFFLETNTSVYEIVPAMQSPEAVPIHKRIIGEIEKNLTAQPESVQKVIKEAKDKFIKAELIDGKTMLFTGKLSGIHADIVLCLVADDTKNGVFKLRAFRFSGSDHQWKALPGLRESGSYLKGDEGSPLHHYVQSAKLDKRIYQALDSLPESDKVFFDAGSYLPIEPGKKGNGRFADELEFQEEYIKFQDPDWANFQERTQNYFQFYDALVSSFDKERDFSTGGVTYAWVSKAAETVPLFKTLKAHMDVMAENVDIQLLRNTNIYKFSESNNEFLKSFLSIYQSVVGNYFERVMQAPFPAIGIVPNFEKSNMVSAYIKKGEKNGEGGITVEEYKVRSKAGDELVWAMAYDSKGRVYIDNIYDPRVGMSSYGIPNKITQMGILIYKPEDYEQQTHPIPSKYKKDADDSQYVDISAFWENLEPVKNFKAELIKRGALKKDS